MTDSQLLDMLEKPQRVAYLLVLLREAELRGLSGSWQYEHCKARLKVLGF